MSTTEQQVLRLEAALNTAPVGLATLDLDFRYVHVNRAFAAMYDKRVEDFPGRLVTEALPLWADQIIANLDHCLRTGELVQREISLVSSDGQPRVYLRSCQPVRDHAGKVIGLSAGLIDITERQRAGEALRESEDNYRHAIELNPHIPWTCGSDGEEFEISSRWTGLTGQKSGRITIQDWAEAPHPDDLDGVLEKWKTSRDRQEPLDVEYRVRCADGSMRWVRARATPRLGSEGEIVRWYGMIEDIDERKRVDAALAEERRRLELVTEQLSLLVREDHLTGLANRRHFDGVLEQEIAAAARTGLPLTLVMFDVDRFKSYNDRYGHVAGDTCLRAVGAALKRAFRRRTDLVARYGGEEFAAVLPETSEEQAAHLVELALREVRSLAIEHAGSSAEMVTVSAGVATLSKTASHTSSLQACSELVRAADAGLYLAKESGRDRWMTVARSGLRGVPGMAAASRVAGESQGHRVRL